MKNENLFGNTVKHTKFIQKTLNKTLACEFGQSIREGALEL